ncbi:accessory Sec system protein Asp1 [Lactococcus sp. DD01]|uniref:accessory Sec system protein Asp1 n=1 Tax=Lactococcus sp. DD01 TaxID=1776443 RepID=UPI000776AD0B|nr:accessory Sec system protein Asp1 [Lactococcus sp. DD01]KXT59351.1 Accessory secretory protein Asp1 [Lactococcus sp. DD01]
MIYFIPAWEKEQIHHLNTDDLTGQISTFMDSDQDYKVIVLNYNPELHYFLHQFDLLESNYVYLYDKLQLSGPMYQKSVNFSDLSFPNESYFVYTPFNILVYLEEALIGTVTLGRGSQILEVSHYSGKNLSKVEVYDDRGFLSNRKIYEGKTHIYTDLLDDRGNWIIREFEDDGRCELNKENMKGMSKGCYKSKEELQFEILDGLLKNLKEEDAIVMSVTDKNIEELKKSSYLKNSTLSLFQNRLSLQEEKRKNILVGLLNQSKALIVDTEASFQQLKSIVTEAASSKIFHLTPYDTRFELSISQEIKEEVIYLEGRSVEEEELSQIIEGLVGYMTAILEGESNQRSFRVIVRIENNVGKEKVEELINQCLYERFALEMEVLSQAKPIIKKENTIDEEKLDNQYPQLYLVRQLKELWSIQSFANEDSLFKIIHEARVIIDLSNTPDLFTQIAGISAAIPQINKSEGEYIHDGKNGKVLQDINQLNSVLSYYLDTLRHWQEARAYSAQQIKQYSGWKLREKLCDIIGINV